MREFNKNTLEDIKELVKTVKDNFSAYKSLKGRDILSIQLAGSYLNDTNTEDTKDVDIIIVVSDLYNDFLSHGSLLSKEISFDSPFGTVDAKVYSLTKLLTLLRKGNPNIIEPMYMGTLYMPTVSSIYMAPLTEMDYEEENFLGYSQLSLMSRPECIGAIRGMSNGDFVALCRENISSRRKYKTIKSLVKNVLTLRAILYGDLDIMKNSDLILAEAKRLYRAPVEDTCLELSDSIKSYCGALKDNADVTARGKVANKILENVTIEVVHLLKFNGTGGLSFYVKKRD